MTSALTSGSIMRNSRLTLMALVHLPVGLPDLSRSNIPTGIYLLKVNSYNTQKVFQ